MPYRFKEAMLQAGYSVAQVANALQVSEITVRSWNNHHKKPPVDTLCRLADLYGVTTDYLLGRSGPAQPLNREALPVPMETLRLLHGCPVWEEKNGWGLVDAIHQQLMFVDGRTLPFPDTAQVSALPPALAMGYCPLEKPIPYSGLGSHERVWASPVGVCPEIQRELQGWYQVRSRYVENEFRQRFYFDNYGSKWLAFEGEL
ncbi:MAG: helix-turn-helix transcriptional regulator [Lachnospiraceae bacterium]|nr:helix-turn-helix transcriptional regulator [Lachnospiraceae bacterium]